MKVGRILLALVVLALAALWVAPAVLFTIAGPDLAKQNGLTLAIEGTTPALPLGFEIDRVDLSSARGDALRIENAAIRLYPSGWDVRGELASGSVFASVPLEGTSGWVRFHDVAVDELPLDLPSGLVVRGRASGAAIWQDEGLALSVRLLAGSVGMMLIPVGFEAIDVVAERRSDRSVDVRRLTISGPELEASGSGRVDALGEVAMVLDLLRLEDPLLSVLSMVDAVPRQIPTRLEVEGRLPRPQIREMPIPGLVEDALESDDFDDPF